MQNSNLYSQDYNIIGQLILALITQLLQNLHNNQNRIGSSNFECTNFTIQMLFEYKNFSIQMYDLVYNVQISPTKG